MSLQREAILRRVHDLLVNRTDADDRVSVNRAEPDLLDDLPNIGIFGLSEKAGTWKEETPRRIMRTLTLVVDLKIADPTSDGASLRMNRLAEQVERIVLGHVHLPDAGGDYLANDVRWVGCELTLDSESKAIVDGLAVSFEVDYVYEPEEIAPPDVRSLTRVHFELDRVPGLPSNTVDDVTLQGG